jgi:hypothetical protein
MPKMLLTPESIVKKNPTLLSTRVDNDVFILNPLRESYVGLDEIGRRLWDLMEAPTRVDRLCAQVAQEYQGDLLQIPADVMAFLNELNGEGLLEVQ